MSNTHVSDDAAGLAGTVADTLIDRLVSLQAAGGVPSVVLTGGGIADEIHHAVAHHPRRAEVSWDRVEFFWGDERFVAPDSADRNEGQARAALLDHLPVAAERVHPMGADAGVFAGDPGRAAAAYAEELPDRPFDIVMLGVGPDGHCASLFPGHPQVLATEPVTTVADSPKQPPVRLTLTLPRLCDATAVWFVVSGDGKAAAVAAALRPGAEPLDVPSAGPRGLSETTWYLDRAAAALLP